ncbi:30S ribosomal protein S3 [Candidatus Woesearchaeota archaeon]|nr:30S ribosomal protein S3 [Candidatus Woesearchaeota archaeon]MBW3021525.1 30S ribosomal protein S3 [Candidatus Woesearchaeota archaeon]
MIERKFVAQNMKEYQIQEYITNSLKNAGHSHTKMQRTPLGEKIIIYASRPGLIVGRKGQSIKKLTVDLKRIFGLENPQIEIAEVQNINLDAQIVAERIANSLERFGSARFKGIGHKVMSDVMGAGAKGVEILISGKIPSARAKTWRFYQGYLKKSGDVAVVGVDVAYASAQLKTGTIGIKVSIMPPGLELPDDIKIIETPEVEEVKKQPKKKEKSEKKPKKTKKGKKEKEAEVGEEEPRTEEKAGEETEEESEDAGDSGVEE